MIALLLTSALAGLGTDLSDAKTRTTALQKLSEWERKASDMEAAEEDGRAWLRAKLQGQLDDLKLPIDLPGDLETIHTIGCTFEIENQDFNHPDFDYESETAPPWLITRITCEAEATAVVPAGQALYCVDKQPEPAEQKESELARAIGILGALRSGPRDLHANITVRGNRTLITIEEARECIDAGGFRMADEQPPSTIFGSGFETSSTLGTADFSDLLGSPMSADIGGRSQHQATGWGMGTGAGIGVLRSPKPKPPGPSVNWKPKTTEQEAPKVAFVHPDHGIVAIYEDRVEGGPTYDLPAGLFRSCSNDRGDLALLHDGGTRIYDRSGKTVEDDPRESINCVILGENDILLAHRDALSRLHDGKRVFLKQLPYMSTTLIASPDRSKVMFSVLRGDDDKHLTVDARTGRELTSTTYEEQFPKAWTEDGIWLEDGYGKQITAPDGTVFPLQGAAHIHPRFLIGNHHAQPKVLDRATGNIVNLRSTAEGTKRMLLDGDTLWEWTYRGQRNRYTLP